MGRWEKRGSCKGKPQYHKAGGHQIFWWDGTGQHPRETRPAAPPAAGINTAGAAAPGAMRVARFGGMDEICS